MSYTYTKLADYIIDQLWGYQSVNLLKNNIRYLAEDIFGDPSVNSNQVSMGSRSPGWTSNLEISRSAGVFTIQGWGGTTLSATNPGWVCVPSATSGRSKVLKVTQNFTFRDDAHVSSDLSSFNFGVTTGISWSSDVPFFIYVVVVNDTDIDGADGSSSFGITRNPCMTRTISSSTKIGNTSAVASDVTSENCLMILQDSATPATYASKVCQRIGCFKMTWSGSTNDWTVQTLDRLDGIGEIFIKRACSRYYNYPVGHNNSTPTTHFIANGGTPPTMTSLTYDYMIDENGLMDCFLRFQASSATAGSGAVASKLTVPIKNSDGAIGTNEMMVGMVQVNTADSGFPRNCYLANQLGTDGYLYIRDADTVAGNNGNILYSNFTAGSKTVTSTFRFRAFVNEPSA